MDRDILDSLLTALRPILTPGLTTLAVIGALWAAHRFLERRLESLPGKRLRNQLVMAALTFVGLLVIIMVLPIGDTSRGQLLSLLGILLSAAIALSATTFVGNAMAGLMLRGTRSFRGGDFLQIGEHFGRVSERGLFHLELQTEDRDLLTLPNLYLVTQPYRVVRASGTIVAATVSLGYDVPRARVAKLLAAAAGEAGLEEPFVQVRELGDFAVTYRVAGLLTEVKNLISARSLLLEKALDELHRGGVEIVSPNFMNTRAVADGKTFIPPAEEASAAGDAGAVTVETVAFDKAEEAEKLDQHREAHEQLGKELKEIEEKLKAAAGDAERRRLEGERDRLAAERERLEKRLADSSDDQKSDR